MAEVLTVFLSSTARDLTAYRDAVHARLSAIGCFRCIRQEDFSGHHTAAVDFCCEQAKKADLFVGLIGPRRGWEPDGDATKRSITEMEYDNANTSCRFIYTTPEDFSVSNILREPDALNDRQIAFRQRVMNGRIVSPKGFGSPDLLASTVVEQLLHHVMQSNLIIRIRHELARVDRELAGRNEMPDEIAAKLLAALDSSGQTARAAEAGVERQTVFELARRLKPSEALDFKQAVKELVAAVGVAIEVSAKGGQTSNFDDLVDTVRSRIADMTKTGDIDGAAKEADRGFAEWQRAEADRREASARTGIALLEAGIEQDILRRDAKAVARRVENIIAIEHSVDAKARFDALRQRQDGYYVHGRDKGINFSLEIAIELARSTLGSARDATERGTALNDLGTALKTLGERESGTARLEEAVAAYRNALKKRPRERMPLDWATTQNNLGAALSTLGERERGTVRLEEAVAAFRNALREYTPGRTPLDWAMTQHNLGTALKTLGQRESGTARLEEAVAAFRDALKERTRERVPLGWATTQNNLGTALKTLGDRESGTGRLEEAVAAYRDALKERTRERVPLEWAGTQNNLGNALSTLGGRESGTARLEEAVVAYRDALKEYTRERVPFDWATTQNNLGATLSTLGERESGTARLEEAVVAYRDALKERTRERVPLYWAATQNNLGNALSTLGERESGTARLEEAVAAFRDALKENKRESVPLDWATTQNNLGNALRTLGERESGTARLEEAVAAYRNALTERTRERVPLDWAMTQVNLGIALQALGERASSTARLAEAVAAHREALQVFEASSAAYFIERTRRNLAQAEALLAARRS